MSSSEEFVMVPVPKSRVMEVYTVLGRPLGDAVNGTEGPAAAIEAAAQPAGDTAAVDEALVLRAYRESPPSMVKFLDHLASQPGATVPSPAMAQEMGLTWNQLAGVLGAFGRRWKNRYAQKGPWFFGAYWNYEQNHMDYSMSREVADIIKEAQSGS